MIKYNFAVFILVAAIYFNCGLHNNQTTIIINLEGTGVNKMEVFNIVEDLTYDLSGSKDTINLDLQNEIILDLFQGRYHSYIHVKPGDKLVIDTISSIPITMGVVGNPSSENKYLDSFWRLEQESSYSYMIPEMSKLSVDSFKLQVIEKNKSLQELLGDIYSDQNVSANFKHAMKTRFVANLSNDLSYYKDFYFHQYQTQPIIPLDYYQSLESMELSDSSFLLFEEGRLIVSNYHSKALDFENYNSLTEFYTAAITSANNQYGNSLVAKYCHYELLTKMISFGDGIDIAMEMINEFRDNLTEHYFNTNLAKLITPWEDLVSGSPAPDFEATTIDGAVIKLSELKGKRVYVDIWATWCGPCIAEIPYLKKIESELSSDDIVFVSVSIDETKDKQKWKNFVTQNELTGLQLLADGDWKSDIVTAYNIKGIPRFLLIDEEGKIISANALRPSNEKTRDMLLK